MPPASTPHTGGFTFAEQPEREAPEARIIWHADLDPGTLEVAVTPGMPGHPDAVHPGRLARWLTLVTDRAGHEHAVLSDGWRRIRLDLAAGSLAGPAPIILHYRLLGVTTALRKLLPLRRLLHLCRYGRFSAALFPTERRAVRGLLVLRVHDALAAGASQREIAEQLYGPARVRREWAGPSDSMRSRVRRLVRDARVMARGGYRALLQAEPRR